MLRSQRHILENQLEVLQGHSRALHEGLTAAGARLRIEKDRYEALAQHWQRVGLDVVLTDHDRTAAQGRVWRTFVRGFLVGMILPAAVAVCALLS